MFGGFYNLSSEMLCQTRNLNIISNNMANVTTTGFKKDEFQASTFRETLMARYNGSADTSYTPVGSMAMIRNAQGTVTDYTQGSFRETESPFDFALLDQGFFAVQTADGTVYTRNGSFTLDEENYLVLQGIGRVLGEDGPIRLDSDEIICDNKGNIFSADGQQSYGTLTVVDFEDYDGQLLKIDGGVFKSEEEGTPADVAIRWKAIEGSNVNPADEMIAMMSSQRSLQSAAQILKMYDHLMDKTVTQLGPV